MCLLSLADELDVDRASVTSKDSKDSKAEKGEAAGEEGAPETEDKGRKTPKEEGRPESKASSVKSDKGQRTCLSGHVSSQSQNKAVNIESV